MNPETCVNLEVSYLIECEIPVKPDELTRTSQNTVDSEDKKNVTDFFNCTIQSEITIFISDNLIYDIQGFDEELGDHYSYIFEKTEEAIKKDVEKRKSKIGSDSNFGTSFMVTALIAVEVDGSYIDPWTSTDPDLQWKTAIKPSHVTGFYLPKRVMGKDPLEESSKIQINIFYCNTQHPHCNK